MKVLVVEDDTSLSEHLAQALRANHYQVEVAADGEAGLDLVEGGNYDLVLLDLYLPRLNGISFCQQLRAEGSEIPIVLMTAERAAASQIMCLDAGADDYVVKPLNINELLARMRAVLRRSKPRILPLLVWADVCLDPSSCEVFCHGQRLHLTSREYQILELLLRNPHRVFSLDALIERLWPMERVPSDNAVRTHIKSVRQKLRQAGVEGMIETVYGLGYRLSNPDPFDSSAASVRAGAATASARTTPKAPDPLRATWERHRPKYLEMVASLRDAISSSQAQDLVDTGVKCRALRRSQAVIHTLKGTLGSFGLTQASQIAGQIEACLRIPLPFTATQLNQLRTLIEALRQSLESHTPEPHTPEPHTPEPFAPRFFIPKSFASESFTSEFFTPRFFPLESFGAESLPLSSSPTQTNYLSSNSSTPASLPTQPTAGGELPPITGSFSDASLHRHSSYQPAAVVYEWLIIDNDRQMIESLLGKASILGIQPQIAYSPDEAWRRLAQHVPTVVTFDLNCATSWNEGIAFLAELTRQYPSLSLVVLSDRDTLNARVNIVRSGGCTFLPKPVDVAQVLETVSHIISQHQPTGARIVALDDDDQILLCLQHLLSPWGFQLTLLSDPTQFWQALEQTLPDLLILDIEMPDFNGLELCQVIRSDPRTAQIPILFLSAHTDPDIVRQVFEVGADDYISKPIVGPELISRILNRLERLRFLRKLAEIDSLTGLSRRRQSAEMLDRLLRLSIRQQAPLCMALLDLDHFKQINDRYGHDVGDQVLKVFGEYLRKTFRGDDVIARWGGEEFVVGLYDVSKELAMKRLNALRENFGQHLFQAEPQFLPQSSSTAETPRAQFQVSLSGGIATAPVDGETIETLYHHADQALYRAKGAGRNQIHSFS